MNAFVRGYLQCVLWAENDNTDDSGGEPLDKNYDVESFSAESMRLAEQDCAKFEDTNQSLLDQCGLTREDQGADFWLNRVGHGTGFQDHVKGDVGKKLYQAAKAFGEVWVAIGDDGELHLSR